MATISEPITQYTLMDRISAMSRNTMVMSMGVAAAVPVLLMSLAENMATSTMALWVAASLVGGWVFGGLMHSRTRRSADHSLHGFAQVIERVAEGNLQDRLDVARLHDSDVESQMLIRLGNAINRMLDRLHAVTVEISSALRQIDNDTHEILSATGRQITMASEQDKVVTETTATVNEVRATVTETAERVQSVAETAQVSVNISRAGTEAVQETVSGMELIRRRVEDIADNILVLSEHTQQIGEIIATVNNLADQSRMLALNASVEAARAGEEGKGFAVVALEVRNLADQNRDATVQVREILGEIQRATNSAVMVTEEGSKGVDQGQVLVNRAGDAIRDLAHAIEEAALAAMQIAASTRQQTIGMDQLTQAMRTIKHATAETVTSTMQVEASVQRLRKVADRVNEVMAGLKI